MKNLTHMFSVLLVIVLAGMPLTLWPHAGLVRSEPGRRAVLTSAPQQIRLCFNERVEPKFSSVTLVAADGEAIRLASPAADTKEPQCLVVDIEGVIAPGSYTVKYKVLSVDGHIVDYGFGFSLRLQ